MSVEQTVPKRIKVVQGRHVTEVLHRAVRRVLLEHQRAGNTIAAWEAGRVVLIPAAEIKITAEDVELDDSSADVAGANS